MRVLLVEDERSLAQAVADGLHAEGFIVDVAYDGTEGMWRAGEYDYDLIILDIMLPGTSGYEICRALRAASDATPILMLTAKDAEHDEADALDLGADDYLTKPFSYLVLVARLRALLRRRQGDPIPLLSVGSLSLDPAARRCWRAGQEVSLTAREFALTEFLLRHKEEVVSKSDIVHHVWDTHFDGELNIVEVYVARLRRKLDTPFGATSLQTVRGAGYRLSDQTGTPS
ncbi:MAG: response regulator transcription factor [Actinomycetota bacterium]|nr:response regulator transcription factor [Actinomycetota bacterium]